MKRVLGLIGGLAAAGFLLLGGAACEPPHYAAQYPGLNIDLLCNEIYPLPLADAEARLNDLGVLDPLKVELMLSINPAQNCP